MSRSPGPGLSRVRRGTDTPGEWDRSSRSACGPHAPPSRLWAARGGAEGCGLRPDPGLPSLRDRGRLTQRTLSLASLGCVVVGGLPVVGGLHPTPRCSPPGRAERVAPGPPWCPWSAPGRLRCLKPSGGAVPCSQRTPLWVAAVGGVARGGRVAESVKGGTPVPPAVGSGRLVVPAPQRAAVARRGAGG